MSCCIFCLAGHTAALRYAAAALQNEGYTVLPKPDSTATHVLLPVPSFEPDGRIKGGTALGELLEQVSKDAVIVGGNLQRPELEGYQTLDLLQDPQYTAENAAITAHCAMALAAQKLPVTFRDCSALVIGWGRIGKCLAQLLAQAGADVTVAARKENDRAMLTALGCRAVDTAELDTRAYRLIFNTAPVMLLAQCPGNALKIDLASKLGIGGPDVLWARGLPGKDAPESSGALISRTVIRIGKEQKT